MRRSLQNNVDNEIKQKRRSSENKLDNEDTKMRLNRLLNSAEMIMDTSLDVQNKNEFISNVESAIRYVLKSNILDPDRRQRNIVSMIRALFPDDGWPPAIVFIGNKEILDLGLLLKLRSTISKQNIQDVKIRNPETVKELLEIHTMLYEILQSVQRAFLALYDIKANNKYGPIVLFSAYLNLIEYENNLYNLKSKIGGMVNPKNLKFLDMSPRYLSELLKNPDSSRPWIVLTRAMIRNEEIMKNAERFLKLEEVKRMIQSAEDYQSLEQTTLKS